MYAFELFENGKPRVVVTYPGRFQPFHQGHAGVFAQLQKKFGADNVFIATSNDTSSAKSPFNFSDKYQLMTAAGVPGDKIVETNQMYVLPQGFDPAGTVFVTAVGSPDADRLRPDSVLKKDKKDSEGNVIKPAGSPGYYKSWGSDPKPLTSDQHGYVIVIPEIKKAIKIKGKVYDVSHGTETRSLWNAVRNDQKARAEFLTQLYGGASAELAHIFDKIPSATSEDISNDSASTTSPIHGLTESVLNENEEYVLYLNGKPSAQYTDTGQLKSDLMHLKKKYPNLQYEIRKEICKEVPVTGIAEATYLQVGDVTDKVKAAVGAAKQLNAKVVKTAGGYFKIAPLDDPRPAIDVNPEYFDNLKKYKDQLKRISATMSRIEDQHRTERFDVFRELDKRFPNSRGRTMNRDESGARWLDSALYKLNQKYFGTDEYKSLAAQKKELEAALKNVRDQGNRSQEKQIAEEFNSKQEVINHFVKQGKPAAAGAAAWERGWRGTKTKTPTRPEPKSPQTQQKYWWQDVDEDAAGVGVVAKNKKMARDPRYSMSITKDVKPETPKDMLRAFRLSEEEIDPADFEIRNFDKLDSILLECCEMVIEGQKENDKLYGMVAACVVDPENRLVYGINTFDDATDSRKHAERVAIENYTKRYGDIPKGSIIITTLSPCCHPMDERYGESCTDLINSSGVHKVYCGYKDPTQEPEDKVFHVMCTRNEKIRSVCKKFADTFLNENFADGKHPEDKGDSRRYGIPKHASISSLRKIAKQGGRKGQLAHWQANMRSGRQKANEDSINEKDMMQMIKEFLPLVMQELKLKKLPHIVLQPHIEEHEGQATFGRFVNEEERIYLGIADRHPVDILRTLAHELVHFKQYEQGEMYPGAGKTGSPIENEAHMVAGILMRHFNKKYPDAIKSKPLELSSDFEN